MINLKLDEDLQYRLDDGIINLIDDKELINAMVSENVYDKLQFNFYTLDINAERLTKNPSVKSDPWFLIYNFVTSEKADFVGRPAFERAAAVARGGALTLAKAMGMQAD